MKVLETSRMILRHLEPGDLDVLYSLYRDPEIRRFFPDGVRSYQETKEELDWFVGGHPDNPSLGLWATILKEEGLFIGRCGLLPWEIDGKLEIEIAYMIAKPYWRMGLASEAARGLVTYAFRELSLSRVIALIDPEHGASIGVAKNAGLQFERVITMDGIVSAIYSLEAAKV